MSTATATADGAELASYLQAPAGQFVTECAEQAEALVARALLGTDGRPLSVPGSARYRAVLEVGAELYNRRGLKYGVATFGGGDHDLQPVRANRDPLHMARAILAPFIGGPFA